MREGLVEGVGEVLTETKSKVRIKGGLREIFWTARGVSRRCPLSPMLFNMVLADLEEKMKKVR